MRRLIWHSYRFYRRKIAGARRIEGLVLDVGSGNSPYPRADVLAEKFLLDDSNRIWGRKPILSAPVVACDAEALPFSDDMFDFVVASHLLEHVDRPDRVMLELSRVGKAGYVECPDSSYDKLDSPPYHRWFVEHRNGRLIFTQKDRAVFDEGLKALTHDTFYNDHGFWGLFWRRLERFFVMYRWEGSIDFEVRYLPLPSGNGGSADNSVFDDEQWLKERGFLVVSTKEGVPESKLADTLLRIFWKTLSLAVRGRRPYPSITDVVVCPSDRSKLDTSRLSLDGKEGALDCVECGREFKVIEGIPHLFV